MTFFLTNWFYKLLQLLYGLFNNNYLPTIIVVTVLLRLVQIFPDINNRKTQIKMQAIQPEIDALQKKYKDDPNKFRLEQSKLTKAHGISTWSSCLPLLLVLPLFFCFLNAFRCWGNEESIMLMYQTAVSETAESEAERSAAAETAQDTFDHFKFLWVHNIWQPDCLIDSGEGGFLLFRFDADVVTKPASLKAISSVNLANMPMFKTGYKDVNGNFVEAEKIWSTLVSAGLAQGSLGDAGAKSGGCSSCNMDRSGMSLLPDSVDQAIVDRLMPATQAPTTEPPVTEPATEAPAADAAATEAAAAESGETAASSGVSGTDIYKSMMQRYPDSLSKNGKTPANGLLILPVLAAAMQLLTMLVTNKKNKQQNEQAKQMNAMMYVMPLISVLVCMSSTTAFAFYWTISGAMQFISTLIINAIFAKKNNNNNVVEAK